MAAIDQEKNVSRRIAENHGHKLSRFKQSGSDWVATCQHCDLTFTIHAAGTKRCADNIDQPCPNSR